MTLRIPSLVLTPRQPLRVQLADRQTLALDPVQPGISLEVREGSLWITQEGDPNDYVLGACAEFTASRSGRLVLQALGSATVVLPS